MTIKNTKIIKELPSPSPAGPPSESLKWHFYWDAAQLLSSLCSVHNAGEYVNIFLRSIVGIFSVEWMSDAVVLIIGSGSV